MKTNSTKPAVMTATEINEKKYNQMIADAQNNYWRLISKTGSLLGIAFKGKSHIYYYSLIPKTMEGRRILMDCLENQVQAIVNKCNNKRQESN